MAGKIQNEDIKSAAELVSAGATAASLPNDDKVYVTASSINKTLKQAIIDGDIGGGGAYVVYDSTAQDITSGGTITVSATDKRQMRQIQGNGGSPFVTSTTPFGTGTFIDGQEFLLIGRGAMVSIPYNDATKGVIGNFESLDLSVGEFAKLVYVSSISRFLGSKGVL